MPGQENSRRRYYVLCQLVGDTSFFVGPFRTEQGARDHVGAIKVMYPDALIFWEGYGMQPGAVICYGVITGTAAEALHMEALNTLAVMPRNASDAREALAKRRAAVTNPRAYQQAKIKIEGGA